MRILGALLLGPLLATAQVTASPSLVRGILVDRDAQADSGELSVRMPDSQVLRYRFDGRTAVMRDRLRVQVARLRPGDEVEVESDAISESALRYARSIQVESEPAVTSSSRPLALDRLGYSPTSIDRILGTATLGFSGVVLRLNRDRVILHTRHSGDQPILLRPDTRFIQNGSVVKPGDLKPNMRVFVRGGRTLYNEIEAYQVVWGQILLP